MARPFMFAALCQRAHPLKHSLAESIFVSLSPKNSEKKIFVSRKIRQQVHSLAEVSLYLLFWSSSTLRLCIICSRFPTRLESYIFLQTYSISHLHFPTKICKVTYNSRYLLVMLQSNKPDSYDEYVNHQKLLSTQRCLCLLCSDLYMTSTTLYGNQRPLGSHFVVKDVACAYEHISREPLNYDTGV